MLALLSTVLPAVRAAAGSWRLWLMLAVFAGFAAVAGQSFVDGRTIRALEADKATLAARLVSVGGLLADQNKAVATLREASDAQTKRATKAAKAAERALGASNARADSLY